MSWVNLVMYMNAIPSYEDEGEGGTEDGGKVVTEEVESFEEFQKLIFGG